MAPLPVGTVTFLFTDIEGSTRLWERDPAEMQQALARHDGLLRDVIEGHGGAIFKTVGDAFCAVFASPQPAIEAAIAGQRVLQRELPWIGVRMAIHTGTAEHRGGDYFGSALNRVARLLAAGHGRKGIQALVLALDQVAASPDTTLRLLGRHQLRDIVDGRRSSISSRRPSRKFPEHFDVAFRAA
jgi:class 3 adenylate cyclase